MTQALLELADWLIEGRATHVAMESSGVYWKPIYNLLQGLDLNLLVNARHIKTVPGRKTDVKDADWIAQFLQHGLPQGSCIPGRPRQELREVVRFRRNLIRPPGQVVNRVTRRIRLAGRSWVVLLQRGCCRGGYAALQGAAPERCL